jgi:hypothetical protein
MWPNEPFGCIPTLLSFSKTRSGNNGPLMVHRNDAYVISIKCISGHDIV